jgi:hypothetical protein
VDLKTDNASCGKCGASCASGKVCSAGACALTCQQGLLKCDGTCTDPTSSLVHCGASGDCAGTHSGVTCAAGEVCSNGACSLTVAARIV